MDDIQAEYVRQIVRDHKLYYSAPIRFNDPFDCAPVFQAGEGDAVMKQYMASLFMKFTPGLDASALEAEIERNLGRGVGTNQALFEECARKSMERINSRIGVLSLSSVCDDLLMWSHYASSHQGVCLKFHSSVAPFSEAFEVKYQKERPVINIMTDDETTFHRKGVLIKSDHWAYEREWRIIDHIMPGSGPHRYPRVALCGIICGSRITNQHRDLVIDWTKNRRDITIYQAYVNTRTFELDIRLLS